MLIYAQQSQAEGAVVKQCRRCGQSGLEGGIAVCPRCFAQEEVARHIPPMPRLLFGR